MGLKLLSPSSRIRSLNWEKNMQGHAVATVPAILKDTGRVDLPNSQALAANYAKEIDNAMGEGTASIDRVGDAFTLTVADADRLETLFSLDPLYFVTKAKTIY